MLHLDFEVRRRQLLLEVAVRPDNDPLLKIYMPAVPPPLTMVKILITIGSSEKTIPPEGGSGQNFSVEVPVRVSAK